MNDNFVRRNLKRRFKGTYKKRRKIAGRGKDSTAKEAFVGKTGTGSSYAHHLERQGSDGNDANNEAPSLGLDPLKVIRVIP